MKQQDFWKLYMGDTSPAEFMSRFQSRNPSRVVDRHVRRMPGVYGIVRQQSWRDTFLAPEQFTRERVISGLTAYLEETRTEWEAAIKDLPAPPEQEEEPVFEDAEIAYTPGCEEENFSDVDVVAMSLALLENSHPNAAPDAMPAEPPSPENTAEPV